MSYRVRVEAVGHQLLQVGGFATEADAREWIEFQATIPPPPERELPSYTYAVVEEPGG